MWLVNTVFWSKVLAMRKYISIFRSMLKCLLVARKENSTGFSTGLTGRSKNLDPTGNPTGRSTRPVSISELYYISVSRIYLNPHSNRHDHIFASATQKCLCLDRRISCFDPGRFCFNGLSLVMTLFVRPALEKKIRFYTAFFRLILRLELSHNAI